MNSSAGITATQLQHLLDVVRQHREERCTALLEEADARAQQLRKNAWRDCRARLHQAAVDQREHARRQIAAEQARNETQRRQQQHRQDRALLTRAWEPLREALLQRWRNADSRHQWTDALLAQASAALLDRHWRIEHPADWPEQERRAVQARLGEQLGQAPLLAAHEEVDAGLRIRAGEALIDGTPSGLLRSRSRIEAIMLAALNQCRRNASGPGAE